VTALPDWTESLSDEIAYMAEQILEEELAWASKSELATTRSPGKAD